MTPQQSSWGTCGFLLCVMQLATLLGFHTSLTLVGWPPPAMEVSRGVGGVLLQMSCYPTLVFFLCASAAPTSAASPSGFCALAWCVSMPDSSLLVYSWGCAGGIFAVPLGFSTMCRALPQGLQRALLSRMQVQLEFSGHRVSVLLLRLVWVRTAVQPSHGSVLSFTLDSSSLAWLRGEPSTVFLLLCLPSGCGHPLGVISVFCHYCSPTKVAIGGVFLLCGRLPFRSAVVVSLRPLSVCYGS